MAPEISDWGGVLGRLNTTQTVSPPHDDAYSEMQSCFGFSGSAGDGVSSEKHFINSRLEQFLNLTKQPNEDMILSNVWEDLHIIDGVI